MSIPRIQSTGKRILKTTAVPERGANAKPRLLTIKKHLEAGSIKEPLTSLAEFIRHTHKITARWERADWKKQEAEDEDVLNAARIVGQVWFRGQRNVADGLQPGLYREKTWKHLRKNDGSPQPPKKEFEGNLVDELFDLEHELRIDFTSFGHLLNVGHAKDDTDWYFLMQHHGLPTRLLDWTTNALAALFFAAEGYREETKRLEEGQLPYSPVICVWMMDAYWLANRLSHDEWMSPILAWSEDAIRYIPPLKSLADKMSDSYALLPDYAMPIEPPAMHPRVASQEGRFVIFGRTRDLLDEKIRLEQLDDGTGTEELRLRKITVGVSDVDDLMQELAQLGVSRRTLFPDLTGLADFIYWKHLHKMRNH
jgi:hypothetical protein